MIDGGNVVKCGDVVVMTDKVFEENIDKSRNEVEQIFRRLSKANCCLFLLIETETNMAWDIATA